MVLVCDLANRKNCANKTSQHAKTRWRMRARTRIGLATATALRNSKFVVFSLVPGPDSYAVTPTLGHDSSTGRPGIKRKPTNATRTPQSTAIPARFHPPERVCSRLAAKRVAEQRSYLPSLGDYFAMSSLACCQRRWWVSAPPAITT
jgi:hypothetical protein